MCTRESWDSGKAVSGMWRLRLSLLNGLSDYVENVAATRCCGRIEPLSFAVYTPLSQCTPPQYIQPSATLTTPPYCTFAAPLTTRPAPRAPRNAPLTTLFCGAPRYSPGARHAAPLSRDSAVRLPPTRQPCRRASDRGRATHARRRCLVQPGHRARRARPRAALGPVAAQAAGSPPPGRHPSTGVEACSEGRLSWLGNGNGRNTEARNVFRERSEPGAL